MRDVAHLAGVSVQTVSAVINDKPGITSGTAERVRHAIQSLNYRPFSVARSLRTRQTRTIALIVSDIANPSLATMASAAEEYARSTGYTLMLYNTHDDIQRERSYIQSAIQHWIAGVLIVPAEDNSDCLRTLQAANIPFVTIDRRLEGCNQPSVILDHYGAGRVAAEHLIGLGHRCVGHIAGPLSLRLARERLAGFYDTAAKYGLRTDMCYTVEGSWNCESGYQAMRKMLACRPLPTGIFSANDRMGMGAMRAIFEARLRVPDDISVIGLDDIEVAAYQIPPLTTIRQPFAELATRAVRLLLDMLEGKQPEQAQVVIEPSLVLRCSTAARPSAA